MTALVREQSLGAAKSANRTGVIRDTSATNARHSDSPIALVAKALWKSDRAKLLAKYASCSPSTAKRLLRGRPASFELFLNLLRGDHGDMFLDAFLADAEPKWWRRRKQIQQLANLKREQQRALKALEQLEINFAADD